MSNYNTRLLLLAGIAAGIVAGAVVALPSITGALASTNITNSTSNATSDDSELTTFEEEALKAEEETTAATNATMGNETMTEETNTAAIGDNGTIVLQGTVSSPGEVAGPLQIIDLLPPTLDGNIYTGWVTFTATEPLIVAPLNTYNFGNETVNPDFGELFVFPGIPNGTMIAPALTMPDYATQEELDSDIPMPKTFSATVPFTASGLSLGRLDGKEFIVSYTLYATVHPAQTAENIDSAIANETEVEGTEAIIKSGSAFLNETAYSPNPIEIERGDTVTWINRDLDPHTVTSGTFDDENAGEDFDSGYMGPQSSFEFEFNQRGEFEYFCEIHPNMVGTVIVE